MKKARKIILLIGVILLSSTTNAQWNQIGLDIDGEATLDYSGTSISASDDGLTVAIGAFNNDGNGLNAGHVRVFKFISGVWTQLGGDIDGEAANDNSGGAVSISGDGSTVAIGAKGNDDNGSGSGHIRVYKLISGIWIQQGGDIDGEAINDGFGFSVSISDDGLTVVGGAWFNDGNGTDSGHARVYKLISGVWTQLGIDLDGSGVNGYAGHSVSISSDGLTVAIGEPGRNAGQVQVFKYISNVWIQQGSDIFGEALGDYSGEAVSLSNDGLTVAIGASANNGNGSVAGHVRVYKLITGVWTQQGGDIDGELAGDQSGAAVCLDAGGLTVAIGATNNGGNGPISGHVRVHKLVAGVWIQQPADINGEATMDYFGKSVSLSTNGHTVAIGAYQNDGNGSNSGHARVYSNCINTVGTDMITACDSYLWIDNNTYTTNNTTATHTLVNGNANGCDSVVTLNLTVNNSTASTDTQVACNSYLWIDNNTYTTNNTTATHTLVNGNANGCDSLVTLNLTINTVDVSTINNNDSITANATAATYRWLDCNNSYAVITGETNALFIATANGSYAVEVTQNGCVDTSTCVMVTSIGISEHSLANAIVVFPNPNHGLFIIEIVGFDKHNVDLSIVDVTGKTIYSWEVVNYKKMEIDLTQQAKGMYFLLISSGKESVSKKIAIH